MGQQRTPCRPLKFSALVKVARRPAACQSKRMTWEHALIVLNTVAAVGSAWTTRRADRWQAVAQGVVRRTSDPSMARTRVWPGAAPLKRTTPGQRLLHLVDQRRPPR